MPFHSPGGLPDPGIELESSALEGGFFTAEPPGKPMSEITYLLTHNLCFLHDELSINMLYSFLLVFFSYLSKHALYFRDIRSFFNLGLCQFLSI